MLYKDNVHTGRAGYQAPGSRSLTQVHTNFHWCNCLPRNYQIRVIKLIRGLKVLKDSIRSAVTSIQTPDLWRRGERSNQSRYICSIIQGDKHVHSFNSFLRNQSLTNKQSLYSTSDISSLVVMST